VRGRCPMKHRWIMYVVHTDKEKALESFNTYKAAKEALDYRYILWYHLGSDPRFKYVIKKG